MTHVLGDGYSIVAGARFAPGEEVSIVVSIDHSLGSVAKDAFVVPESIDELICFMRSSDRRP
jgi:hypothetical protein